MPLQEEVTKTKRAKKGGLVKQSAAGSGDEAALLKTSQAADIKTGIVLGRKSYELVQQAKATAMQRMWEADLNDRMEAIAELEQPLPEDEFDSMFDEAFGSLLLGGSEVG